MEEIVDQIEESNGLVEEVYALLDQWDDEEDSQMRTFAEARARTSVRFTASLYLTAWHQSAEIRLPRWLER